MSGLPGQLPCPSTLILGHRGSPLRATENTLRSLALALTEGADGVELDVRRSRDGVPVVIHDDTLTRTTGARGQVSLLDWPAIARLSEARVPSFEQIAAWAAAAGAWLNVELKSSNVEASVLDRIDAVGTRERTILSSFDPAIVRRAGEMDQAIRRFLLAERWGAITERDLARSTAEGLALRADAATDAVLEDLATRGIDVIVWTVNDPARVRQLVQRGISGIITDDPGMAAAERKRLAGD